MKIILTSENSIRLVPEPGPMTIEAQSLEQQYSPFHMLGSSLAFCTFSVMFSWATHVKIPVDDLTLDVSWEFGEDPHRVAAIALSFDWPGLPDKRLNAAKRAAELCTIHATLMHPPTVTISATTEGRTMPQANKDEQVAVPTTTESAAAREAAEARREAAAAGGEAELPPKPVGQGDGQEAGTAPQATPPSGAG